METFDTVTVDFDGPNDQQHPRNWPAKKKTATVAIITVMAFVVPLTTSMLAPGVPQLMREFNSTNPQLSTFVVSIDVLGLAVGPLLLGPLSEIYGRSIIYKSASLFFFACMIACALAPDLVALIIFRFLSGCAGAVANTNSGGTITDIHVAEERGAAMAWIGMGTLVGPVIGPVLGGFVTQGLNWRWTFWILAIVVSRLAWMLNSESADNGKMLKSGVTALLIIQFLDETYPNRILQIKARKAQKLTGTPRAPVHDRPQTPSHMVFSRAIVRPIKLLLCSPVILALSVYLALIYGEMYILFTTYPEVFSQQYQFSANAIGLSYLGLGVGLVIGTGLVQRYSDKISQRMTTKNGSTKPE
ncbi:hypothetical protein ACLMJK_003802 [Lecanora helva]